MTHKPTLTQADLAQFSGSKTYFQHGLNPKVLYTEGVQYVAETADAFWLVAEIAILQVFRHTSDIEFQRWTLTVSPDQSATLICKDREYTVVCRKHINAPNFTLNTITFFCVHNRIILPSEY